MSYHLATDYYWKILNCSTLASLWVSFKNAIFLNPYIVIYPGNRRVVYKLCPIQNYDQIYFFREKQNSRHVYALFEKLMNYVFLKYKETAHAKEENHDPQNLW